MKINITGYSPQQNHTKLSNRKGLAGMAELLKTILEENGYEADYNLKNADVNIVFLLSLASINTYGKYVNQCAELLRLPNTIIAFDDWNIKDVYSSHEKAAEGYDYPTHHNHKGHNISKNSDVFEKIINGEYVVLYPSYSTGDHELLGIRGDFKYRIDYSRYVEDFFSKHMKQVPREEIIPVHASLSDKTSYLKKLGYKYIDVKKAKEAEVFEMYQKHGAVIVPPHYHNGSGWSRNRYTLANLARALIVEDNSGVFGPSFAISGKILFSENFNEESFNKLFELQNKAYQNIVMEKEEVSKVLKDLLGNYRGVK